MFLLKWCQGDSQCFVCCWSRWKKFWWLASSGACDIGNDDNTDDNNDDKNNNGDNSDNDNGVDVSRIIMLLNSMEIQFV